MRKPGIGLSLHRRYWPPAALGLALMALHAGWSWVLAPALMVAQDTVSSLAAQRDQLAQDVATAAEDLSLVAKVAADYRALEAAGTFAPQDRLALSERLDARLARLGIPAARYAFLPVQETRAEVGGFPLLRRTVVVDVTLDLSDDLHALSLARLPALGDNALLRVESFSLKREETPATGWAPLPDGSPPVVAKASLRLSWTTLAPAPEAKR